MRTRIHSRNGEAEMLKDGKHLAYCKFMFDIYAEDNGAQTQEASISLMREGLREDEFKKMALYLVFNRGEIYTLRFADGSTRRISLSEFNAFSAIGKVIFQEK